MCRKYSYLGSRRHGGFAEYVAVPADNLIELPDSVSFDEAAMMEPMAVAAHSLRRAEINPDDRVVICGLGTIGMFILMLLIEKGIRNIFVIGNKESQKKKVIELGISEEHYCDAKSENSGEWIQNVTGDGADVYFECVGKSEKHKLCS